MASCKIKTLGSLENPFPCPFPIMQKLKRQFYSCILLNCSERLVDIPSIRSIIFEEHTSRTCCVIVYTNETCMVMYPLITNIKSVHLTVNRISLC